MVFHGREAHLESIPLRVDAMMCVLGIFRELRVKN